MSGPEISRSQLAQGLLRLMPSSVRRRLMADDGFRRSHAVTPERLAMYGIGSPLVPKRALFDAIRRVFAGGAQRTIAAVDDRPVEVALINGRIRVSFDRDGGERADIRREDYMFLAPNAATRREALARLVLSIGPTGPDPAAWEPRLEAGALDDDAMEAFSDELDDALPIRMMRVQRMFDDGRIDASMLAPPSRRYWERLCGPSPGVTDMETWLRDVLMPRDRALLRRDSARGLDLCLAMSVRDDLSPRPLVAELSNDELWSALAANLPLSDPFSLLGALDLALDRAPVDDRFAALAADIVPRLCAPVLDRGDGIDVYAYLPAIFMLVQDELRIMEGVADQPSWWRRLCAWTQAAMLVRAFAVVTFDPVELSAWCDQARPAGAFMASMLELREAPAWRPGDALAPRLHAEVVGRLFVQRAREEATGRTMVSAALIDEAGKQLTADGLPLAAFLPGPLETDRLPTVKFDQLQQEQRAEIEEGRNRLSPDLSDPIWRQVGYLARLVQFDSAILTRMTELMSVSTFGEGPDRRAAAFHGMSEACMVALAQRHRPLAEAALGRCLREAGPATSGDEAALLLRLGVIATAVLGDREAAMDRLAGYLMNIAGALPRGAPCRSFHREIQILKPFIPAELWRLSRAEAMAALGR